MILRAHHSFFIVNFTWFVFLGHQKFHDSPLFKPGAHYFYLSQFWIVSKNYFYEINIFLLQTNSKRKIYIYGKKILVEIIYFDFLKEFLLFIERSSRI